VANLVIQQQQLVVLDVQEDYPIWYPEIAIPSWEILDFIKRAASFREMNVSHVITVVQHEGGWNEPTLRNYAGEPAWGPLQLHVAAEDYRPGFERDRRIAQDNPCNGYVGDQFICHTGIHPSEPRGYKMAIEFGLDYAIKAGTWAAWYGAKFLPNGRFTQVSGIVRGFSREAKMYAGIRDGTV
jgi:hypothetical protein